MTDPKESSDLEAEIRREIDDHLELEAEAIRRGDESSGDALRRARLAFGNPALVRENVRAIWVLGWLERLIYDIRFAVRLWARSPGLSTVAILTIALGIGAATAIVAQVNAVFWRPLPVEAPGDLRLLAWSASRYPYVAGGAINALPGPTIAGSPTFGSFSYPAYEAMRDGSSSFRDLACWVDPGEARPVALGELGFAAVQFVSGNYFRTLGVRAAIGRTLQPEDDGPSTWSPVAIISDQFWRRAFGADEAVTSQTIHLNGRSFAIVGVMPETFFGMDPSTPPDIVVPIGAVVVAAQTTNPLRNSGIWSLCRVVGRLAHGVPEEKARLEVERAVAGAVTATPPAEAYDTPRVWLLDGRQGVDTLREAASAPLGILLGGVGVLLLAACANIAGLLLARGSARHREIATRLALGAPRRRLVRQFVTESLVLSAAGGALGIALAYGLSGWGRTLLSQFLPTLFGSDRTLNFSTWPDVRVLGFAIVAIFASSLLFGLSPALRTTRVDLICSIRQVNTGGTTRGRLGGTHLLVAGQTALAVVLLVAAGLFLRTLMNLRTADLGFQTEGLLYARVEPRSGGMPQDRRAQFFEDVVLRLAQLPGVRSASAATRLPLGGKTNVGADVVVSVCEPDQMAAGRPPVDAAVSSVAPRYFETLGVPILAGRDFRWSDAAAGLRPLIVNEAFVRLSQGSTGVVGREVRLAIGPCSQSHLDQTIVGVVGDFKSGGRESPMPAIYLPLGGVGVPVTLLVRTAADDDSMIPVVRRAVKEFNASIPTFSESTLPELRNRMLRRERLLSSLLSGFGLFTVFICALGIYGTLSYTVSRRQPEIGVRMAIGATGLDVVRLIGRDSLVAVMSGLFAGLAVALALTRALGGLLYGVSFADPVVLLGAVGLFLFVAVAAAALPARAAARVDPLIAFRQT